ncbi:MAG TPA: galactose mutarotase [Polyangiaceae bacterium]|nr:galactose mutarotase [Polyangiaceae bacterium]
MQQRFRVLRRGGALPTVELEDGEASSATVAPGRGGMVLGWRVGGRELLYLDEATYRDVAQNVRGGIPVLFPSPGRLAGDAWARGGASGELRQHGFARQLPWQVRAEGGEGEASVTLALGDSAPTRARYPFAFEVTFVYAIAGPRLRIEQRYANRGEAPMPFAAGFHPYFAVRQADKAGARVESGASRAFDNVQKREAPFAAAALDLGGPAELDLHLVDHGAPRSSLAWPDGARVRIEGSPEFTHWVVWSLPGRDFVCLEPWTSPPDALNTGERLLTLAPGEERVLNVELTYEPAGVGAGR